LENHDMVIEIGVSLQIGLCIKMGCPIRMQHVLKEL
jgi:hypothetical protein